MNTLRTACMLLLLASACAAHAQIRDPVVVSRGGASITMEEIDARVIAIPRQDRAGFMNSPERIEQTLQALLMEEQLAEEARALGLDKEPLFEAEVALAAKQILARRRLEHLVDNLEIPDFSQLAHERYMAAIEKYSRPERLDLRHVLVKPVGRSDEEARARAEEVRELALSGTDFSQLVREYSDEGKVRGARADGRLPNTVRGVMVPEFEEAAFALEQVGDISPVVETPFGYHVIILDARKPAETMPFEQVRDKIIAGLRKDYIEERRKYHTDSLRSMPLDADPDLVYSLRSRYMGDAAEPAGDGAEEAQPDAASPVEPGGEGG